MKVEFQVVTPEGHPRGEVITTGAGRILVAHAPPAASPSARQKLGEELSQLIGPDEYAIVIPDGCRLEVMQPVEVA